MHPKIDEELCIGSQNCIQLQPEVFVLGDDGLAHVHDGVTIDPEALAAVARQCPTGAIQFDER